MSSLDWLVLVSYFVVIASIGAWFGRTQKGNSDFLLGGRSIPWWAALLSLVATEISAATFLGAPEQGYLRNLTYLQIGFGALLARFVLAYWFITVYYEAGVTTVYEFLGRRFGGGTQRVTAGLFLFGRLFADGSRLFIAAITVEVITGWPLDFSIFALALVTILYTSAGGIKAVIWTDVLQAGVLMGAGLALFCSLFGEVGKSGLEIWSRLESAGKLQVLGLNSHWFSDPYNLVTAVVGGFFLTLATHGTDHDMVQRLLTCKSGEGSRRSMWLSGFVGLAVSALFLGIGLLLFLYTTELPPDDPLLLKARELGASNKDGHFLLFYAIAKLPRGLIGLIVAGVLAAAMSSLSSALNAMTATFVGDFYRHWYPSSEDRAELRVSRFTNLAVGVLVGGLALLMSWYYRTHSEVDLLSLALGVMTFFYGGLLGIFLVALFTKQRGNDHSNLAAAVISTGLVFLIHHTTTLAWPWYVVVGTGVSCLVSISGTTTKGIADETRS